MKSELDENKTYSVSLITHFIPVINIPAVAVSDISSI